MYDKKEGLFIIKQFLGTNIVMLSPLSSKTYEDLKRKTLRTLSCCSFLRMQSFNIKRMEGVTDFRLSSSSLARARHSSWWTFHCDFCRNKRTESRWIINNNRSLDTKMRHLHNLVLPTRLVVAKRTSYHHNQSTICCGTWHELPQYQTTRQAEHFLRLLEEKQVSHLVWVAELLGTNT